MLFGVAHTNFFEVLKKGENVKLKITALFDGLRVFNGDSIKPYIHQQGQPGWEFPMPPVKTGASSRLVEIVARRRVGSKKRCAFLYPCEWDEARGLENRVKL